MATLQSKKIFFLAVLFLFYFSGSLFAGYITVYDKTFKDNATFKEKKGKYSGSFKDTVTIPADAKIRITLTKQINEQAWFLYPSSTKKTKDALIKLDDWNTSQSKTITKNWNAGTYEFKVKAKAKNEDDDGEDIRLTIAYESSSEKTWYRDSDGDGYGDPNSTKTSSTQPSGYVSNYQDCNDSNDKINPGATEVCDSVDNDCDGSIDEGGVLKTYYLDSDGDGYGDDSTSVTACSQPSGYVTDNTDCDDENNAIHPGASEICDYEDNDCDGTIDDGLTLHTYYLDSDGDGYGDSTKSITACSMPPNYVTDNTDCNDLSPSVHPGAYDACSTTIDEDCSGSNDNCTNEPVNCRTLANYPLETQVQSADPLLIFLIDDSGSMSWDTLCPESNGVFGGNTRVSSVYRYWKSQWSGYNGVYYDPALTYNAWIGYSDSTVGLTGNYHNYSIDGIYLKYAHYYVYSSIKNAPYLVNITSSSNVDYYKVTTDGGFYGYVTGLTSVATPPSDVAITRTVAEELQNMQNWYTYYRTRQNTAKSAVGNVINSVSGIKIGIHTLNNNNSINITNTGLRSVDNYRSAILADLYKVGASGGTPLRSNFKEVGDYFSKTGSSSPFETEANGGSCQQAFAIVMTDGYYNGSSPGVGNVDGDNGVPYADTYSDTLADVAMKYYENDLQPDLPDLVPTSAKDTATHQHMVTFSVSFGLKGTLDPDLYPNVSDFPNGWTWPQPNTDEKKIDDLWHTAVNGRGSFVSAANANQLATTLASLMQEIQHRSGSGASVAINTEKLEAGAYVYRGSYSSAGWTGDVKAYAINASDGSLGNTPKWSAAAKLDALSDPSGSRKIFTHNGTSGVEFTYDNLSSTQKAELGDTATIQKAIIDYIRGGDNSSYRSRTSLLGDIVHSAPVYHKKTNTILVGANDGMFHAFKADTGDELFAYIPSFAYEYGYLKSLADPDYEHRFFVDGTAYIEDLSSSKSLLVCGLGKGGKGYFALNVATPSTFSGSDVLWEYPSSSSSAAEKDNLGYSFSKPAIITLNKPASVGGSTYSKVVIFGNGYDSKNGKAVLYILSTDGKLIKMIDTGYGNSSTKCNGLSTPIAVDLNFDDKADYVYAGDLQGNMWKFDISGNVSDWKVEFSDGTNPQPLFQAKDSSGNPQPITAKPGAGSHCDSSVKGPIIVFGTGSFNTVNDFSSSTIQSIYAVWDWSEDWKEAKTNDSSITVEDKYLGYRTSSGYLSNIVGNSYFTGKFAAMKLLEQKFLGTSSIDSDFSVTSVNEINWFNVDNFLKAKADSSRSYLYGYNLGWYIDLTANSGERVIADATVRSGLVEMISLVPSSSPCKGGGYSISNGFKLCSGKAPSVAATLELDADGDGVPDYTLDKDGDGKTDEDINGDGIRDFVVDTNGDGKPDTLYVGNTSSGYLYDTNKDGYITTDDYISDLPFAPNIMVLDDIYYKPGILSGNKYDLLYFGSGQPIKFKLEPHGIINWRLRN